MLFVWRVFFSPRFCRTVAWAKHVDGVTLSEASLRRRAFHSLFAKGRQVASFKNVVARLEKHAWSKGRTMSSDTLLECDLFMQIYFFESRRSFPQMEERVCARLSLAAARYAIPFKVTRSLIFPFFAFFLLFSSGCLE